MKSIQWALVVAMALAGCTSRKANGGFHPPLPESRQAPSSQFSDYWYQGEAELNSYQLSQSRYGETRMGEAVMVFVTEPFSRSKQVKLDQPDRHPKDRVSVFKLNMLRKFQTGIYDYSTMLSVFTPVSPEPLPSSLKVTFSSQDWCGQSFSQLNLDKEHYLLSQYSYFESEGDATEQLRNVLLEDELWNLIRMEPENLPTGNREIIPALLHSRFQHLPSKMQQARLSLEVSDDQSTYRIEYLHINRTLEIIFEKAFPHRILEWKEKNGNQPQTIATLKRSMKSAYWTKNSGKFDNLRDTLGLIRYP